MKQSTVATRLKHWWQRQRNDQSPYAASYQVWRRQFLHQRLRLSLQIGILAYVTFILLRFVLGALQIDAVEGSWFVMAATIEAGLVGSLLVLRSPLGRRHPEWIFLGCSWSITLIEQIWATARGEVFTGLFSWTLVFLAQATLMPVRWQMHMLSQVGVLLYYFVAKYWLGLRDLDQGYWNASLWLYLFWFCCICNGAVFLYERLQRSEFYARRSLEAEQRKSEQLLLNILPETVARQLKQNQGTIAENFAEVTVLFADIVGFTQLSAGIPPHDMVTLLNHIFSAFDRLAERHGLEKIKTIGDAYMVVGGLPLERPDHVEAIANMALDMQQAIAQFNRDHNQSFSMRMGIHTGPVVAGVIGVKKFIYDLWGDTVNIASRMESHGLPGGIQVTQTVYDRLKYRYRFETRGLVTIKGKGEMLTYMLLGATESRPSLVSLAS
ncbi:MAG TPA: adenylate/guanylate cyclase domain-containing protein [Chroococcidiopsis sp.]